jgi:hypothetical protein
VLEGKFLEQIVPALLGPLHHDHPELPKIQPLFLTQVSAVILVIFGKFTYDGRLALDVVADLRTLDFEEIIQGILSFGLCGIGQGEHRVRGNGMLQVGLLPVELQSVLHRELLERDTGVFKTGRRMALASYPFGWECCKPSEPSIETNVRFASSTGLIRVRRPRKWSTTSSQFSGTEKVVLDQGKRQDSWLGRGYHSQAD